MRNNIKQIRLEKFQWNQRELARKAGLHYMTVGSVENGHNASDVTRHKIAKALGCKVGEVFPINDKDETNDKIEKQQN